MIAAGLIRRDRLAFLDIVTGSGLPSTIAHGNRLPLEIVYLVGLWHISMRYRVSQILTPH